MIYDINQYQHGQNQGFNWGEFAGTVGDTIQSGFENIGSTFDANAINSVAIANLNQAQADAIRTNAENKRQITKSIFTILIVAIIAVSIVSVIQKFWK